MKFTDKEIMLAKRMKEAGLVWSSPQPGNWFLLGGDPSLVKFIRITNHYWYISAHRKICEVWWLDSGRQVWLPLWHQCREMLEEAGWRHFHLTHNIGCRFEDDGGAISVSVERGSESVGARGETDLEAIYKLIYYDLVGDKYDSSVEGM